jgi:hypothetical protein
LAIARPTRQSGVGFDGRPAPEGAAGVFVRETFFSPLWPLLGPQGVELCAAQFVVLEQDCFDLFHLRLDLFEPLGDGLFFDPFDPVDRGERIAVGEHGEAFNDGFLTMVFTVENSPSCFGNHSLAGGTAVSLPAFARKSEFDDVNATDTFIVRALLVPAKGARFIKLLGLGCLRTFHHAEKINNSRPGDHPASKQNVLRRLSMMLIY